MPPITSPLDSEIFIILNTILSLFGSHTLKGYGYFRIPGVAFVQRDKFSRWRCSCFGFLLFIQKFTADKYILRSFYQLPQSGRTRQKDRFLSTTFYHARIKVISPSFRATLRSILPLLSPQPPPPQKKRIICSLSR